MVADGISVSAQQNMLGQQSGLSLGLGREALVLLVKKLHLNGKVRRFNNEK